MRCRASLVGFLLAGSLLVTSVVQSETGAIFHYTDVPTDTVVMQAQFPAVEVCNAFLEMALQEPDVNIRAPSCSGNRYDTELPITARVEYGNLGFSVMYRFINVANCDQFVQEFNDAAQQYGISESDSRLAQGCEG